MTVSLILDGVVAGLLAATIGYAMVLNRKLADMRNAKAEMEAMVRQFAEATAQAQRGLADLKVATGMSGDALQKRLSEAKVLSQDLSFLVDKGSGLADRLETQIAAGRSRPTASAQRPAEDEMRTREEAVRGEALRSDPLASEPSAGRAARLRAVEGGAMAQAARQSAESSAYAEPEGAPRKAAGSRGNAKLMHALRAMR